MSLVCPGVLAVLVAVFVNSFTPADSNINVYVDRNEVQRFTGVKGSEIFYIQEGVLNKYAAGYVVPVSANISTINFHWQSRIRKPMPYEISIKWNDIQAMNEPSVNISHVGYVPRVDQVFSILLPCSGKMNALVDVEINMNISTHIPNQRVTHLRLKRTKTCREGKADVMPPPDVPPDSASRRTVERQREISLILGMAAAVAVTFFTLTAAVLMYIRQRAAGYSGAGSGYGGTVNNGSQVFLKGLAKNYQSMDRVVKSSSYATIASLQKMLRTDRSQHVLLPTSASNDNGSTLTATLPGKISNHYASSYVSQVSHEEPHYVNQAVCVSSPELNMTSLSHTTLDLRLLSLTELVAEGGYARLYRASYQKSTATAAEPCLVKTLATHAPRHQRRQLLMDAAMLSPCCASTALLPLGVCGGETKQSCIVYPDTGVTYLKTFLDTCRLVGHPGSGRPLSQQNMVDMAIQMLKGVQHLHSCGLVHKDIAARNCVVDQRLRVRVTDCALSRDLHPTDYAPLTDSDWRPARWLAPEAFLRGRYAPPADLWAAAVACWEVTSLGGQPFAEVRDPLQLPHLLQQGHRLTRPEQCPQQMYNVMLNCWNISPERRPPLPDVIQHLLELSATFDRLI